MGFCAALFDRSLPLKNRVLLCTLMFSYFPVQADHRLFALTDNKDLYSVQLHFTFPLKNVKLKIYDNLQKLSISHYRNYQSLYYILSHLSFLLFSRSNLLTFNAVYCSAISPACIYGGMVHRNRRCCTPISSVSVKKPSFHFVQKNIFPTDFC